MRSLIFKAFIIIFIFVFFVKCNNNSVSTKKETPKDSVAQTQKDTASKSSKEESNKNISTVNSSQNNSTTQQSNVITTVVQYPQIPDFMVLSATSQKWHGGARGSGSGTKYEISIIVYHSSAELVIDQLWIGQTFHSVEPSRKYPSVYKDGFSVNDTVYIHANDYQKDPSLDRNPQVNSEQQTSSQNETTQNTNPPYAYKGEALIGYTVSGKRLYKEIGTFVVNPPLNYP